MGNRYFKFGAALAIAFALAIPADAQFAPGPSGGGSGTVTSVGLTGNSVFDITSSPVITSGSINLDFTSQAAAKVFASPAASVGLPLFRSLVAGDLPNAGVMTGGVITGTFPALTIGAGQITTAMQATNSTDNTKLAQMPTMTVKSNITGATANAADNTVSAVIDAQLGAAPGTIAYRGASTWNGLAPSADKLLQSNGAANPSWVATVPANSVNTAAIADASVTTAKLATPAASGASVVLLGSNTVTGAAALPLTGYMSSAYDFYTVVLVQANPGTSGSALRIQYGAGGVYDATANYYYSAAYTNTVPQQNFISASAATGIAISGAQTNLATSGGANFELKIYAPSTINRTMTTWTGSNNDGTYYYNYNGSGVRTTAAAISDVQFLYATGTITGTAYIYGHRKI